MPQILLRSPARILVDALLGTRTVRALGVAPSLAAAAIFASPTAQKAVSVCV